MFYFREGGWEGEREGEKHGLVDFCTCPGGLNLQLRHVGELGSGVVEGGIGESNLVSFWFEGQGMMLNQLSHTGQATLAGADFLY